MLALSGEGVRGWSRVALSSTITLLIAGERSKRGGIMDHLIGILLIVFGAPIVGLTGQWIEGTGRKSLGKAISIGGYLVVLGIAGWLIVRSF